MKFYNECGLPAYHVIGNHDDDGNEHSETLKTYRMESGHYFFDRNGFRFVVVDPNHIKYGDGRIVHYSKGNYFKKNSAAGDVIGVVPPESVGVRFDNCGRPTTAQVQSVDMRLKY